MPANDTDHECPENGCEKTLRVRDHGGVTREPVRRRNLTLVPPSEVEQCAAIRKSDGERCPHDAGEGAHVCGTHEDALERGFALVAELRTIEAMHPSGLEYECPHHGLIENHGEFDPNVRARALGAQA